MHDWAEVCHLSQSSKSVLTGILSRCMQYWLKNHWPDQVVFKHSLHTNCISNSAILCNNYISWPSDLCACVHDKKKMASQRKPYFFSEQFKSPHETSNLVKEVMGWYTAQWKCCCFVQKPLWKSHANLNYPIWIWKRRRRKRKHFGCPATFWFGSFMMLFSTTGCVVHHEIWKHSKMNGRLL